MMKRFLVVFAVIVFGMSVFQIAMGQSFVPTAVHSTTSRASQTPPAMRTVPQSRQGAPQGTISVGKNVDAIVCNREVFKIQIISQGESGMSRSNPNRGNKKKVRIEKECIRSVKVVNGKIISAKKVTPDDINADGVGVKVFIKNTGTISQNTNNSSTTNTTSFRASTSTQEGGNRQNNGYMMQRIACFLSEEVATFFVDFNSEGKMLIKAKCGKQENGKRLGPENIYDGGYRVPDYSNGSGQFQTNDGNQSEADRLMNQPVPQGSPTQNPYPDNYADNSGGEYNDNTLADYLRRLQDLESDMSTTTDDLEISSDGFSGEENWFDDLEEESYGDEYSDDISSDEEDIYGYQQDEITKAPPPETPFEDNQDLGDDYFTEFQNSAQEEYLSASDLQKWVGGTPLVEPIDFEYIDLSALNKEERDMVARFDMKYPGWDSAFSAMQSFETMQYAYPNITKEEYDIMLALYTHNASSWSFDSTYLPEDEAPESDSQPWYIRFWNWLKFWEPDVPEAPFLNNAPGYYYE